MSDLITFRRKNANGARELIIQYQGETKTVTEWAEQLGVNKVTLSNRISRGWPADQVMSGPTKRGTNKPKDSSTAEQRVQCSMRHARWV